MKSLIIKGNSNYKKLKKHLDDKKIRSLFLVVYDYTDEPYLVSFLKENYKVTIFRDFTPNPKYEEVLKGIEEFKKSKAKVIIAIGGGSCMDVAKCIKAYSTLDPSKNYLEQEIKKNNITLIACPTTAGTGSEQTRFSVIYYKGVKQSVTSDYIIPNVVFFDYSFLETLPMYQKKSTMLDTFSHSIESYWSVNRNSESIQYAKKAIKLLIDNMDKYLDGDKDSYDKMFLASFYAGCAINISKTTAGHAMAYKITSLYNVSHGHATMLVNSVLLPYMIDHTEDKELIMIFKNLTKVLRLINLNELKVYFRGLLKKLDLLSVEMNKKDLDELVNTVNIDRLKNNPYKLEKEDIRMIYLDLFEELN